MTWRDKLEIGLKDDAPFRRDNLPAFQTTSGGPETQPGDPTRSPEEPGARHDAEVAGAAAPPIEARRPRKPRLFRSEQPTGRPARNVKA
jgi:hypothetical protein